MNIETLGRRSSVFLHGGESKPPIDDPARPGFSDLFEKVSGKTDTDSKAQEHDTMMEAARQMEVHLVTFMLKTMDAASGEGGLLGSSSEGMGYFKDQFFSDMAEEIVSRQGLGFAESLKNTYQPNSLSSQRDSQFKLDSPVTDKTNG
ncbi:MAG: hypothetical protein QNK37_02220 [Acidobacteriota bacterium]|nr:hypothetical protein [Acidobacteriota bacterium]